MGKLISHYKVVTFDVDDTLAMWPRKGEPITNQAYITYNEQCVPVVPHDEQLDLLKKFFLLGYTVIVWSKTGGDWAQSVCRSLQVDHFVHYYVTKPLMYVDDKDSQEWMGERVYREFKR